MSSAGATNRAWSRALSEFIRLVVHIGAAKTGSSAVQDFLVRNVRQLARRGVLVPGNDLSVKVVDGNQNWYFQSLLSTGAPGEQQVPERLRQLAQHCRKHRLSMIVVSAESLSTGPASPALFAPLREEFEISVVLYVRRQDEFLLAAWSQWFMKTEADFRGWLERATGTRGNWEAVIEPWAEALPGANIRVRVYEPARLTDGDVVTDFMNVLGVGLDGLERPDEERINRSLNEVATQVAMRNPHLFSGRHDRDFTNFLRAYGERAATEPVNTGAFLSAAERRALVARYSESNEAVRRRYLPDLPEGGPFSDDYPETPSLSGDERVMRELDLLWNVIYRLYGELRLPLPELALDDVGEIGLAPPEE
ncbi:MAG: hypothetical protein ABI797_03125 [Chloroflexota bacterium]